MKKLVRDNIPAIIAKEGKNAIISVPTSPRQLDSLVRQKMQEEVTEAINSYSKEDITNELGDILEIAAKFAEINGITWAEVLAAQQKKAKKIGAFTKNYILNK